MTWVDLPLCSRTELKRRYQSVHDVYDKALYELQRRLRDSLTAAGLRPNIKYRVKSFDSLYEKLLRRIRNNGEESDRLLITDLIGVRIVCPFMSDLKEIERHIQAHFRVIEIERKGAHFSSREFGYESTHLLVALPEDIEESFHLDEEVIAEIQLRTNLQDAWAEVEHELIYKAEFTPFDEPLQRKLAALNANLTLADIVFQEIRDYQRQLRAELSKRRQDFWKKIHDATGGRHTGTHSTPSEDADTPAGRDTPPDILDPALVASAHDSVDNMLLKALYAHNKKQFRLAIDIYTAILTQNPKPYVRAIIHIHRGMAFFAESDYERAVADFSHTLELDDDNWKAYYYRGVVHRLMGNHREALADFDRGLEVDAFQFDTLFARAQLRYELGDARTAIEDCTAALNIYPDSEEVRDLLRSLQQSGAAG